MYQEERRSRISSLVRIERGAFLLSSVRRLSRFRLSTPKRTLSIERSQIFTDRRGFVPPSRLSARLSVAARRSLQIRLSWYLRLSADVPPDVLFFLFSMVIAGGCGQPTIHLNCIVRHDKKIKHLFFGSMAAFRTAPALNHCSAVIGALPSSSFLHLRRVDFPGMQPHPQCIVSRADVPYMR